MLKRNLDMLCMIAAFVFLVAIVFSFLGEETVASICKSANGEVLRLKKCGK